MVLGWLREGRCSVETCKRHRGSPDCVVAESCISEAAQPLGGMVHERDTLCEVALAEYLVCA